MANSYHTSWGFAGSPTLVQGDADLRDPVQDAQFIVANDGGPPPDGTAGGATLTVTVSLTAGTAVVVTFAPGDTITVTSSVIAGTAEEKKAVDGTRIYEFTANISPDAQYLSINFDSIWSRGNRIENGLIADVGDYGFDTVFGTSTELFDGQHAFPLGNGFTPAGDTPAGAAVWWTFGDGTGIDLRGIRFRGTDNISPNDFWIIVGGLSAGNYFTQSYAADFDEFAMGQNGSVDGYGTRSAQTLFSPLIAIPWPHYELVFANHNASRPATRLANEIEFAVAHSALDGGERRPGTASPSRAVAFSMSSDWEFRTGSPYFDPADVAFDGGYFLEGAPSGFGSTERKAQIGKTGTGANTAQDVVGSWLQFVFPRKVTPQYLMFQMSQGKEDYDSGGNPTKFGKWHWEFSNTGGASWVVASDSWWFREASSMVAPQSGQFTLTGVGDGSTYWRMVLDEGPAFGGGENFRQILFQLSDAGDTGTPLSVAFTDDTDGALPTITIINESPYIVRFSDGTDDGLTFTATIIPNLDLSVAFSDAADDGLTAYGSFYPSVFGQTMIITTGRVT